MPFKTPYARQCGAALALLVMAIAATLATVLMSMYGGKKAAQHRAEATTRQALQEAKEALINRALSVNTTLGGVAGRPGEMPCPDRNPPGHTDEGTDLFNGLTSCATTTASDRIGRIPWRSLQLAHYKDGSGETLWYLLAAPFQAEGSNAVLNSNTATPTSLQAYATLGSTTIARPNAANNFNGAIAIIIAPGAPFGTQTRNTTADQVAAANYLDQIQINGLTYNNRLNTAAARHLTGLIRCVDLPTAAGCGGKPDPSITLFNDQFVVITRDELMNRVRRLAALAYTNAPANQTNPAGGVASNCVINTNPPVLTLLPAANNPLEWLVRNQWNTVLTYQSCTPLLLQ